jgi:hypothetical protein
VIFDYNTVRIATIGDASKVHIWRVIGGDHVRTVLLKIGLALLAVAVGINHAADCSNIARLEFGYYRTDLGDTANNLMTRNAWIDSGHSTPLVANGVEIGVADTAEKDLDLNVVFTWITPRNRSRGKR